jgi:hypothetical protein
MRLHPSRILQTQSARRCCGSKPVSPAARVGAVDTVATGRRNQPLAVRRAKSPCGRGRQMEFER